MSPGSPYRGRFAPSPTGRLHLGLARTALLGWLRARSRGGAFVLRMEDLDAPRVVPGAAQAILDDLRWLGLDWDEGPDVGGPFGPYVQSERLARYDEALEALRAASHLYPCTCTRKERTLQSAPHGVSDLGPVYPGTCRSGPSHPGAPASLRFRVPEPLPGFTDAVRGRIDPASLGDFVVRRSDGLHAYQLAVVVDDIAMEITEVVRGDDLLSSTPWQIALYDALGAPRPDFLHVPLLLGPDGKRLAKRHGAVSVGAFRETGRSAASLVGFLASTAGLVLQGTEAVPRDLVASFSPERIRNGPVTIGPEALGVGSAR